MGVLQQTVCKDDRHPARTDRRAHRHQRHRLCQRRSGRPFAPHRLSSSIRSRPRTRPNPNDTDDAYGLSTDLSKITITGGTRIVGIQPTGATRNPDGSLTIAMSEAGDYSALHADAQRRGAGPRCSHRSTFRSWRPARSISTAAHRRSVRRGRCRTCCSTIRPRTMPASGSCCLICCRSSIRPSPRPTRPISASR